MINRDDDTYNIESMKRNELVKEEEGGKIAYDTMWQKKKKRYKFT